MGFHNLAREYSTTTGTSDAVLSGAVPGCNTWEDAGVTNGESMRYSIITYDTTTHRPTHTEVGTGTFNTGTNTLARTTVISSTNGGSKISMTGLSEVFITPAAQDISVAGGGGAWATYYQSSGQTVNSAVTGATLNIDTEDTDDNNLASVASNTLTFGADGPYVVTMLVKLQSSGSAFNGHITIHVADSAGYTMDFPKGYATADAITVDWIPVTFFSWGMTSDTIGATIDNVSGVNITATWIGLTIQQLG
jgi:hypothetical protein